jgi:hypothetical protein
MASASRTPRRDTDPLYHKGGLAILLGLFTRPVGLVLVIWCVATALIAHTNFADRNQEIHFLKSMAMLCGFLCVAAFGARAWSLDARWWGRGAPAPAYSAHCGALPIDGGHSVLNSQHRDQPRQSQLPRSPPISRTAGRWKRPRR